jgi:hypothetical protein
MGFLQDIVEQLPGAHTENPLAGGLTPSEFVQRTTTGNASDNGLAAINALDPTIQVERMVNGVDKGLGGNGNIFSENSMAEQSNILNTVGKVIASWWAGGVAGDAAGSSAAASSNASVASNAGTIGNVAQGATIGGTAAGMNNQSVGEGALIGAVGGLLAPTTTDPTVVTEAPSATEVALQRAGQSAAKTAVGGGSGDEILTSAGTGAIYGSTANMNPTIAGAINGMVNAGIQADKAGQPIENGLFYGAVTGGAGGAAYDVAGGADDPTAGNPQGQSNELAGNVAGQTAAYAAGQVARNNLPVSPNAPEIPVDPQFEAYMKELTKGYSPQIQEVVNPMVLAAVGNGTEVSPTQLTQTNGISPLLLQGA